VHQSDPQRISAGINVDADVPVIAAAAG